MNSYKSDYGITADATISGTPETFNVGVIDSMQTALNKFAGDLQSSNGGNKIMAVCYSWDRLPAIRNALNGRAFPLADPNVVDELYDEMKKLLYLQTTVNNMIDNRSYTGDLQKATLESLNDSIRNAIAKITGLTPGQLLSLTTNNLNGYMAADSISVQLKPISQAICTLNWQVFLDAAFDQQGQTTEMLPNLTPSTDSNPTVVLRAIHKDNGQNPHNWAMGYYYCYVDASGSISANGKPMLKAYMECTDFKSVQKDNGWIAPNSISAEAHWEGADWNKVTVVFE